MVGLCTPSTHFRHLVLIMLHHTIKAFVVALATASIIMLAASPAFSEDAKKELTPEQRKQAFDKKYGAVKVNCGSLHNAVGPEDYRIALSEEGKASELLTLVENYHWSKGVQTFKTSSFFGDINYILRAIPNHHGALYASAKLSLLYSKVPKMSTTSDSWPMTLECYVDRALRFVPDDGVVWMIWGVYLHKKKKYNEALEKYLKAVELGVKSSELSYNIGLVYVKLNNIPKATEYAKQAYKDGYPLPGLKRKLKKMGAW